MILFSKSLFELYVTSVFVYTYRWYIRACIYIWFSPRFFSVHNIHARIYIYRRVTDPLKYLNENLHRNILKIHDTAMGFKNNIAIGRDPIYVGRALQSRAHPTSFLSLKIYTDRVRKSCSYTYNNKFPGFFFVSTKLSTDIFTAADCIKPSPAQSRPSGLMRFKRNYTQTRDIYREFITR